MTRATPTRYVAIVALCLVATSSAWADPGMRGHGTRAATSTYSRARGQKVRIGSPERAVGIPERAFLLPKIRALPGKKKDIRAGLAQYRRIRGRVRELRQRSEHVSVTPLAKVGSFVIDRLDVRAPREPGQPPKLKVLVVGGVHAGSERVGVESAMRFAERIGDRPDLLGQFDITVVPLANPSALVVRSRRNKDHVDVNRSFKSGHWVAESKAMAELMRGSEFDMVLDLHGAGAQRTGFFVIRSGRDGGLARRFVRALPASQLLDRKGAGKTYALDARGVVTSSNRGTLKQFGKRAGATYSYTFEAPARFSGKTQVEGTVRLAISALESLKARTGR